MRLTSIIAIYALFWVLSAFFVMPFGVRTHDEAGIAKIPGQADSAPANFRPGRIALARDAGFVGNVRALLCQLRLWLDRAGRSQLLWHAAEILTFCAIDRIPALSFPLILSLSKDPRASAASL